MPKLFALLLLAAVLPAANAAPTAPAAPKSLATPDASAVPTSRLRLWLRSTDGVPASGPVARWADQSGHGNDAVQSEPDNQPKVIANKSNGLPVVHFTADHNNSLSVPKLMAGATEGEAFVVLRKSKTTNIVGLWAFGSANGSRYPEGNDQIYDDFATDSWRDTGPAPAGLTQFHLYNVGGDASVWFQNFDGISHFRQTGNKVGFRADPTLGDGQGCFFDGDIAEVIVYDHVLTDAERKTVNDYLTRKYPLGQE